MGCSAISQGSEGIFACLRTVRVARANIPSTDSQEAVIPVSKLTWLAGWQVGDALLRSVQTKQLRGIIMNFDYCKGTAVAVTQFAHVMTGRMKDLDIMQKQVAYTAGWKPSRVSKVLSGDDPNLTIDTMMRLCDALGLRMDIRYVPKEKR